MGIHESTTRIAFGAFGSAALTVLMGGLCLGQELNVTTTFAGGNGQDGNMFDVTAQVDLTITRFDGHFETGPGTCRIYTKQGSYVGFAKNPSAWTQLGATQITGMGAGVPTILPIAVNQSIKAGETWSFYITNNGGTKPNIIYTDGTGVTYGNSHMTIPEGIGKQYPFGMTYSPRTWNGIIYYTLDESLSATPQQISVGMGGMQTMSLDAGVSNANLPYLLLGTLSGTTPGFPIESFVLPLNVDPYTTLTLEAPNQPPLTGSFGQLDSTGKATCLFSVPQGLPLSLIGVQFNHAYVVIELQPTLLKLNLVSNAVSLDMVP